MAESQHAEQRGGESAALEQVLVALQKSFSRLSASSRDVPEENARALVTGVVEFELTSTFDIGPDPERKAASGDTQELSSDHLVQAAGGSIRLTLKGQIATDLRVKADEENSG